MPLLVRWFVGMPCHTSILTAKDAAKKEETTYHFPQRQPANTMARTPQLMLPEEQRMVRSSTLLRFVRAFQNFT